MRACMCIIVYVCIHICTRMCRNTHTTTLKHTHKLQNILRKHQGSSSILMLALKVIDLLTSCPSGKAGAPKAVHDLGGDQVWEAVLLNSHVARVRMECA